MKQGRILVAGSAQEVVDVAGKVQLPDGARMQEEDVEWLPPVVPGTIYALGLNYADHAKELQFQPPKEPLVFLKGPNTLCGHRGVTERPPDVEHMHYECELAVVIGTAARRVRREDAYAHVRGYTVANDYAFREYLENYYRPNLRVKGRDAATPLGPWLVDAATIPDPMDLRLRTMVNGRVAQQGWTGDMIFSVPVLIEYLSSFLTLHPGDVILTGTPEGLENVAPGDVVITEVEGVGRLSNTIVERGA